MCVLLFSYLTYESLKRDKIKSHSIVIHLLLTFSFFPMLSCFIKHTPGSILRTCIGVSVLCVNSEKL